MANEATLLKQYSLPSAVTVADGTGLEKGSLLRLQGANTGVSGQNCFNVALAEQCAGITAAEKIASDGLTKVAVYLDGEFAFYMSGGVLAGQPVIACLSGATYPNWVQSGANLAMLSGSQILGYALENITTTGTLCRVRVHLK